MAVLEVVVWPAKVLETRAHEVTVFDDELRAFVADMFDTMAHAGGIGLAANQVGALRRVLVMNIPGPDQEELNEMKENGEVCKPEWYWNKRFVMINPVITEKKGKFKYQEGCLSFPEIYESIERAQEIKVSAQDEFGKTYEIVAEGLLAVCIQHEIDHIDGIVFFNRMSRLKAGLVKKKMMRRGVFTEGMSDSK